MNIKLLKASVKDAKELTNVSKVTFDDDSRRFFNRDTGGPPGYDSIKEQEKRINEQIYYKICDDDKIIGATVLTKQDEYHMELSAIFIMPQYQSKGIGQGIIQQLEKLYPLAKKWSLDTPSVCIRNHYLYEKLGYQKVNEIMLDPKTNLKLYFYEKNIA